ncbi:NAD-dependent deacylase [Riemerella anatipestifer]|uniref:SIR2 family NAD-dependent protein deacylase n=1 Tax=Riemerella anatipestifer TaxID=34085 RepID=UPI001AD65BD3|nr:NAD-dependent deacylase [Riemerella anatipestifer]MBO4233172.1 NAD-dependent deacylase [Riemerella anatipestifer]
MKKRLVVLSGAGISAESGIKTFRDSNGLWENHCIEDVASPEGFARNPQLVLDFYNLRRRQLAEIKPNLAHSILAELEKYYEVIVITQNVDDLHERAGSSHIIHLHGELKKAKPINSESEIINWETDLNLGDKNEKGVQLRPHIVWFGEAVPEMEKVIDIATSADLFLVIGTSLQVYPAASLVHYIPQHCELFLIDPQIPEHYTKKATCFATSATEGMIKLKEILLAEF